MGKGGGGGGTSQTTNNIPAELSGLTTKSANTIGNLQDQLPLSDFTKDLPAAVAGLSGTSQRSVDLMNRNLSDAMQPLENSALVNAGTNYFNQSIAPTITNEATLSGLGRSTANTNALAAAQAETMLPLLQGEQARRDAMIGQGMQVGDAERRVQQEKMNAEYQDMIRRQNLAEQALYATMPSLPSTLGQTTISKQSGGGGGLFK